MNWKHILKSFQKQTRNSNEITNKNISDIVNDGQTWKVENLEYLSNIVQFRHEKIGIAVDGRVADLKSFIFRNTDGAEPLLESTEFSLFLAESNIGRIAVANFGVYRKQKQTQWLELITKIKDLFAPSFRSLDWFIEVIKPMDEITISRDEININAKSGNSYSIQTKSLKTTGCYEVTTEEGHYICIEISELKPVGDNLLGLTLGLLNDDEAAEQIQGLDEYLQGTGEIDCKVCGNEIEVDVKNDNEVECENCGVINVISYISYEPNFNAETDVHNIDGPFGMMSLNDLTNGWQEYDVFLQENAIFHLNSPEDFVLTVRGYPDAKLNSIIDDVLYTNDGEFYNSDGNQIDLAEIIEDGFGYGANSEELMRVIISNSSYDLDDLYNILNYDNLAGNLWYGADEYWTTNGKISDISDVHDASELSEEDFIELNLLGELGSPSIQYFPKYEVLNYFDYDEEDGFWRKDGNLYEEVDEKEITKNLSSKAVLPINMKWTDYLKKTSEVEAGDWESALKSFISEGKKLGIPLSVIEILKLAKEATTSQSEGFETLHRPTSSEEEEEEDV